MPQYKLAPDPSGGTRLDPISTDRVPTPGEESKAWRKERQRVRERLLPEPGDLVVRVAKPPDQQWREQVDAAIAAAKAALADASSFEEFKAALVGTDAE